MIPDSQSGQLKIIPDGLFKSPGSPDFPFFVRTTDSGSFLRYMLAGMNGFSSGSNPAGVDGKGEESEPGRLVDPGVVLPGAGLFDPGVVLPGTVLFETGDFTAVPESADKGDAAGRLADAPDVGTTRGEGPEILRRTVTLFRVDRRAGSPIEPFVPVDRPQTSGVMAYPPVDDLSAADSGGEPRVEAGEGLAAGLRSREFDRLWTGRGRYAPAYAPTDLKGTIGGREVMNGDYADGEPSVVLSRGDGGRELEGGQKIRDGSGRRAGDDVESKPAGRAVDRNQAGSQGNTLEERLPGEKRSREPVKTVSDQVHQDAGKDEKAAGTDPATPPDEGEGTVVDAGKREFRGIPAQPGGTTEPDEKGRVRGIDGVEGEVTEDPHAASPERFTIVPATSDEGSTRTRSMETPGRGGRSKADRKPADHPSAEARDAVRKNSAPAGRTGPVEKETLEGNRGWTEKNIRSPGGDPGQRGDGAGEPAGEKVRARNLDARVSSNTVRGKREGPSEENVNYITQRNAPEKGPGDNGVGRGRVGTARRGDFRTAEDTLFKRLGGTIVQMDPSLPLKQSVATGVRTNAPVIPDGNKIDQTLIGSTILKRVVMMVRGEQNQAYLLLRPGGTEEIRIKLGLRKKMLDLDFHVSDRRMKNMVEGGMEHLSRVLRDQDIVLNRFDVRYGNSGYLQSGESEGGEMGDDRWEHGGGVEGGGGRRESATVKKATAKGLEIRYCGGTVDYLV